MPLDAFGTNCKSRKWEKFQTTKAYRTFIRKNNRNKNLINPIKYVEYV